MSDLPQDFPCRDKLIRAGFTRYATVKNHRSFPSVRGISTSEAAGIEMYLTKVSKPVEKPKVQKPKRNNK